MSLETEEDVETQLYTQLDDLDDADGSVPRPMEPDKKFMELEDDYDGHDANEEVITAQKVLQLLEAAWRNEWNAPELLKHQTDIVELMMGQIAHMEENMRDLNKNDFRYVVHQMELERIRYMIVSYVRCRVRKIEKYTRHILNEEIGRDEDEKRLSPDETKFANDYLTMVEEHFQSVALQYMPNMHRSDDEQRVVRPNLMSQVFIRANVSVAGVVVGLDDEEVDLVAGSQHMLPYRMVADLVEKGQVQLI